MWLPLRWRRVRRRRQAVDGANLAAEQRRAAAEAHRADAELVGGADDLFLQRGQFRVFVAVIEQPQELFFRVGVTGGAVAAYADAEHAGTAALALGL